MSTCSQTRTFPTQVLTWAGMVPLLRRTRGSFSESPSNSLLKSSRGFPLLLRRTGRRTVTRGRFPSPLISKVRLCAFIAAGLQERQRRNRYGWHEPISRLASNEARAARCVFPGWCSCNPTTQLLTPLLPDRPGPFTRGICSQKPEPSRITVKNHFT